MKMCTSYPLFDLNFYKILRTILRHNLLIIMLISSSIYVVAQENKEAEEQFKVGNYLESIKLYKDLLHSDPNNSEYNYRLGVSFLNSNVDKKEAAQYFEKILSKGKYDENILLLLAEAYTYHLDYDKALETLEQFKKEGAVNKKNSAQVERMVVNYRTAKDLLKHPVNAIFTNLGEGINSEYPDYYPHISKNGQRLLFTSRRKSKPSEKPEFDGYYPSDIFEASAEYGIFENAASIGDGVNTAYDEQGVGLSHTGDTLYIYVDHIEEYGDLYMSVRKNGAFRSAKKLGFEINTSAVEFACTISKNGDHMVFSSNQSGGLGGFDLYEIKKLPDGTWSLPRNLGPDINTTLNEDFPSLSGDGKTLYFCSEGHPGMGGYDIFFSTWDSANRIWTSLQNLGYPLNTAGDNKTISFNDDGSEAYISSVRDDGYGDMDIYKITYPDKTGTPAVFTVNIAANEKNLNTFSNEIRISDEYDELIGSYLPNKYTGRYVFALYPGKYYLSFDSDNHRPHNEVLIVNDFHVKQEQNVKVINLEN